MIEMTFDSIKLVEAYDAFKKCRGLPKDSVEGQECRKKYFMIYKNLIRM